MRRTAAAFPTGEIRFETQVRPGEYFDLLPMDFDKSPRS